MRDSSLNVGSDFPLWELWLSHFRFPLLAAMDEIRFFDSLDHMNGLELSTLPAILTIDLKVTEVLVSFSCAEGFLIYRNDRYFLSEFARQFLIKSSAQYWGGMFLGWRRYDLYGEILTAIRGNISESRHTERWKTEIGSADLTMQFLKAMHSHSQMAAKHLATSGFFNPSSWILDVGGGSGCFAHEALMANENAKATVAELPSVVPVAKSGFLPSKTRNRMEFLPLNFFEDLWPVGHDTVFLSNILHDWSLQECLQITRSAYRSLPMGGRIVIHEVLMDEYFEGPSAAALFSLVMLLRTEGRQLRYSEIVRMLSNAGFSQISVKPGLHIYSVIEGYKL